MQSQWGNFKDCCLKNIKKKIKQEKSEDEKGMKILKIDCEGIAFGYLAQNSLKQKRRDRLGAQ